MLTRITIIIISPGIIIVAITAVTWRAPRAGIPALSE
jgi:hypothetical protein